MKDELDYAGRCDHCAAALFPCLRYQRDEDDQQDAAEAG